MRRALCTVSLMFGLKEWRESDWCLSKQAQRDCYTSRSWEQPVFFSLLIGKCNMTTLLEYLTRRGQAMKSMYPRKICGVE